MAERFGPYQLDALLGRGGMGEVWRAFDTNQNRQVALKLLPEWLSDDEDYRARFRREAQIAATLNEPHVIPIHRFGEIDGRLYLDMRIVEGNDLAAVIRRDGPLVPGRAVAIVAQVASALDAAHAGGLVHRDVKPSNVLVRPGQPEFVYLVDFGIARALDGTKISLTGAAVGTPAYMAPERFDGDGDHRGDVYALGCLLYEAMTGRAAFEAPTLYAFAQVHQSQPPPRPTTARPELPAALDEVIGQALAKNPADRYPSAGALAAAATAALTEAPLPPAPIPARHRSRHPDLPWTSPERPRPQHRRSTVPPPPTTPANPPAERPHPPPATERAPKAANPTAATVIPPTDIVRTSAARTPGKPRLWLVAASALLVLALAATALASRPWQIAEPITEPTRAASPAGPPPPAPAPVLERPDNAQAVMARLVQLVPTARPGVVYTAATDPNQLLGRPNGYTSKVAFADTRVPADAGLPSDSVEFGGSIEVFDDPALATARKDYIQAIGKSLPTAVEYDYVNGGVLVRVSRQLTPDQAAEYETALATIMK